MRNYGKTPVTVGDLKPWAMHDHGKSWSDGGAVKQILGTTAGDLSKLIADETKAAVSDYASNAQMALGIDPNGTLLVGVRLYNEDAGIIVKVPFLELVKNAIEEMRANIATDEQAQAMLSAIVAAGTTLSNIGRNNKQPLPRHTSGGPGSGASGHQQHAIRSVPQRPVRNDEAPF